MILYIIKEVREELGLSLETLSKLSGIDVKRLFEIENNNIQTLEVKEINKIAKALNTKTTELYYTIADYEKVREEFEKAVEEEGINSYRTRKLNVILDKLHNLMLKENVKINKFIGYNKDNIFELKTKKEE